jgi:hypothetical protein
LVRYLVVQPGQLDCERLQDSDGERFARAAMPGVRITGALGYQFERTDFAVEQPGRGVSVPVCPYSTVVVLTVEI